VIVLIYQGGTRKGQRMYLITAIIATLVSIAASVVSISIAVSVSANPLVFVSIVCYLVIFWLGTLYAWANV
jgi:hypothetical protein